MALWLSENLCSQADFYTTTLQAAQQAALLCHAGNTGGCTREASSIDIFGFTWNFLRARNGQGSSESAALSSQSAHAAAVYKPTIVSTASYLISGIAWMVHSQFLNRLPLQMNETVDIISVQRDRVITLVWLATRLPIRLCGRLAWSPSRIDISRPGSMHAV